MERDKDAADAKEQCCPHNCSSSDATVREQVGRNIKVSTADAPKVVDEKVMRFVREVAECSDPDDLIADGGVTVWMGLQQCAKELLVRANPSPLSEEGKHAESLEMACELFFDRWCACCGENQKQEFTKMMLDFVRNWPNPTPTHEAKLPVPSDVVESIIEMLNEAWDKQESAHEYPCNCGNDELACEHCAASISALSMFNKAKAAIAAMPDHAAALARIAELESVLSFYADAGGYKNTAAMDDSVWVDSGALARATLGAELEAKPATTRPEDNCQSCGYRMDACNCGEKPAVTVGLSDGEAVLLMSEAYDLETLGDHLCDLDGMLCAYRALLPHLSRGQAGLTMGVPGNFSDLSLRRGLKVKITPLEVPTNQSDEE